MIVCSSAMGPPVHPRFNWEEFRGAGRIDDTDTQARQRHFNEKILEFKVFLDTLRDHHGVPPTGENAMELQPAGDAAMVSREPDELLVRIDQATETMEILLLCQEMLKLTRIRIGNCIKEIGKTIEREKMAPKPRILKAAWKYVFGKTEDIHPLESTLHALQVLEGQTADYARVLHESINAIPDHSTQKVSEMFLLACKSAVHTLKNYGCNPESIPRRHCPMSANREYSSHAHLLRPPGRRSRRFRDGERRNAT